MQKDSRTYTLDALMALGFATLQNAILADSDRKNYYLGMCNNLH